MCRRQAGDCGDLAPKRAAERQAAEEDGAEDREPAAAHPVRQRDLRGDIERRQNGDPGHARDEARDERRRGSRARPNSTIASAVPSRRRAISDPAQPWLQRGSTKAPPIAPAPMTPSSRP